MLFIMFDFINYRWYRRLSLEPYLFTPNRGLRNNYNLNTLILLWLRILKVYLADQMHGFLLEKSYLLYAGIELSFNLSHFLPLLIPPHLFYAVLDHFWLQLAYKTNFLSQFSIEYCKSSIKRHSTYLIFTV